MTISEGMVTERRYADQIAWCEAATTRVRRLLEAALAQRGQASLILSGGSTPTPVLRALREAPLDWPKVKVSLADERFVPPDHPDSNQRLITTTLDPEAVGARFLPLFSEPTPEAAAASATLRLATLPTPFDVVLLGMGDDGHTASLFAAAPQFTAALNPDAPLCIALTPPQAPHARLSLSLPALLAARHLLLLITGERKQEIYRRAAATDDPHRLPVSAVLHRARGNVEIFWHP